jgi:hypothetical protein
MDNITLDIFPDNIRKSFSNQKISPDNFEKRIVGNFRKGLITEDEFFKAYDVLVKAKVALPVGSERTHTDGSVWIKTHYGWKPKEGEKEGKTKKHEPKKPEGKHDKDSMDFGEKLRQLSSMDGIDDAVKKMYSDFKSKGTLSEEQRAYINRLFARYALKKKEDKQSAAIKKPH